MKKFLYVDDNGDYTEALVDGVMSDRTCLADLAIGDLVMESLTISNGVDKVTDNLEVRSVVGLVIEKPETTRATILFKGRIDGLSGFTKARKFYLSETGTMSSTKPGSGNVHILGQANDADVLLFDPVNTKIKLAS